MTFASRTLLALAAIAAIAPKASALDVTDADFKLGLRLQLQVRAEKGWAKDANGDRFDTTTNTANVEPDDVDFSVRRARIGFIGTYKDVYRFAYILRNDEQDKATSAPTSANTAGTSQNRVPQTHVAYLARDFKGETVTQQVRAGLDYAFFNGASLNSAGWSPLVAARATEQARMVAPRGVGVGYKYTAPKFTVGVDMQNNINDDAGSTGQTRNGEGLFYGSRVEAILWDDAEKPHMKPQESFLGASGKGVLLTVDAGTNRGDNVGNTTTINTQAYGSELFVHLDALTVVAEARMAKEVTHAATESVIGRRIYLIQAAYALPAGDKIIEPAVRLTRIDLNDAATEGGNYGTGTPAAEYGASGYQIELGATYYLNKNNHKVAFGFQHWKSEGGATAGGVTNAKADIVRVQWAFAF